MDKETTVFIKICDTCEGIIKENSPFFHITATKPTIVNIEYVNGGDAVIGTFFPLDFCSIECMENYFSKIAKELSKNKD